VSFVVEGFFNYGDYGDLFRLSRPSAVAVQLRRLWQPVPARRGLWQFWQLTYPLTNLPTYQLTNLPNFGTVATLSMPANPPVLLY
jgi:hypothetical protein